MNFRDALLADHGADRLPVDIDRRLRRRLGLDAPVVARRVWVRPALAAFAVAAAALAVVFYPAKQRHDDVRVDRPAAMIVATPGTQMTRTSANTVLLTHGAIEVHRADATPMIVDVPMGRVVIAASHSTIAAERDFVTILINDGSGHYDDASGKSHPLVPNAALVWPPPTPERGPETVTPPPPRKHAKIIAPAQPQEEQAPPGETPPSVPVRPDAPCTYKSDCDEGQTCRQNERKESVCMGNGAEGAACWFDNDCVSQHCEQRRCSR